MVRTVIETLSSSEHLTVPMDTMTATVRGLNGMLASLSDDLNGAAIASEDLDENMTSTNEDTSGSVQSSAVSRSGQFCPMDLISEARGLSIAMSSAINAATLKAIQHAVPGEKPLAVAAGGLSLLGRRGTDFAGTLAVGGGASFEIPSEVNPTSGEAFDVVAIVSEQNPNKFAEVNQTGNQTGKVGLGGSVSLTFSQSGAERAVSGLEKPILITIPHPPLAEGEVAECRYWDAGTESELTDGCELVASYTNHSVCACTHLTV
jgi:hypothetical protein